VSHAPVKYRTCAAFAAALADERITNPAHGSFLPSHWRTLYELTKLDAGDFDRALQEGIIRPDMERKDLQALKRIINAPPGAFLGALAMR
jgi:hypothetical protein